MDYVATLKSALSKPVSAARPLGCGRVYVSITDKAHAKKVAAAAKKLNLLWQARSYYGTSNALYIGYDNHDGLQLARGQVVVDALKSAGVDCYLDMQGD